MDYHNEPLNKDQKRRDEIMRDVLESTSSRGGIRCFKGMRHATLETLIAEKFADPSETQNDSPSIAEFLEFLQTHTECTCHGYVVDLPRDDYRVSIEGLDCRMTKSEETRNHFIEFCRHADEFSLENLYSWWD